MCSHFRSSALAPYFSLTPSFLGTILAAASIFFFAFIPSVHAGYLKLAWDGPTTNVDGTALTDLSLYRVYFGASGPPCHSASSQDVPSASPYGGGTVTTQVTGLVAGATYAVQVAAVDLVGRESECSSAVSAPALAGGETPPHRPAP